MLISAAVCPHPPLLLPGLTGATDVAADLRMACAAAIGEALEAAPDRVVVVGAADSTGEWDARSPVDASAYGGLAVDRSTGRRLPLSLLVGRTLLDASGWRGALALQAVAADATPADCATLGARLVDGARTTLLVLGDGSARRGPKAPGYVDDRAVAYDEQVAGALSRADAAAVAALDPVLAVELLVAGRAAWQVLAGALGGRSAAGRLVHADDPFGVLYLVATWRCGG